MITFYIGILGILEKFSAIFGQVFASLTPPVASQTTLLLEIIASRYSPLG